MRHLAVEPDGMEVLLEDFLDVRARLDIALREAAEARERVGESCRALHETCIAVRNRQRVLFEDFPSVTPAIHDSDTRERLAALTPREVEVLRLIAEGHATKEIAGLLNISFKTAVSHRTHILHKLQVHETTSLVRLAIQSGLVSL